MKDLEIQTDSKPNADQLGNLYAAACKELLLPFPSVKLLNFPKFNYLTGGLRPREFTILCGATGSGKTTLAANISADLMQQRIPHFVASVETGHLDFIKRAMSAMCGKDLNTGDPVAIEILKKFHETHGHYFTNSSCHLSLYENRFSVETLIQNISWMVKNHGVQVAIIDNLNFFMEVTKSADVLVEMDRVIHNLIIFCKQVDVHIVMVMHPKKTDHGRVESEFDIKGSSTAVQEAHNVFLFNRAHPSLIEAGAAEHTDREIKLAKIRRKGKFINARLLFKSTNGVRYTEGEVV